MLRSAALQPSGSDRLGRGLRPIRDGPPTCRDRWARTDAAWKVFRRWSTSDVFVATLCSRESSDQRVLAGTRAAGVAPGPAGSDPWKRPTGINRVVRLHAGDRASAEIMLGDRAGRQGELGLRRTFRSMSYAAGVRAQAQLQTFIFALERSGRRHVRRRIAQRFRGHRARASRCAGGCWTRWPRTMRGDRCSRGWTSRSIPERGQRDRSAVDRVLLDPDAAVQARAGGARFVENRLAAGPVGRTGDHVHGREHHPAGGAPVPGLRERHDVAGGAVRTPTALFVCDAAGPRDGVRTRGAAVSASTRGSLRRRDAPRPRGRTVSASLGRHAGYLGMGVGAIQTPDIPRYRGCCNTSSTA